MRRRDWLFLKPEAQAMTAATSQRLWMADVLRATCEVAGCTKEALLGAGRYRTIVRPRHIAMLIMRDFCAMKTYAQIGQLMHRDHTTVVDGVKRARGYIREDSSCRDMYRQILERLGEEPVMEAAE